MNPIAVLIVACEIGLWLLLATGLSLRYLVRRRRAGGLVLAGIPLLDLVLVVATGLDLHRGAEPSAVHGLAAVYLGASVAFGPALVRWADVRFAHRFAGGPAPVRPATGSPERQAALWREWARAVLAASIASAVLGLLLAVADGAQAAELTPWFAKAWAAVAVWLVLGPLWETAARTRPTAPVR